MLSCHGVVQSMQSHSYTRPFIDDVIPPVKMSLTTVSYFTLVHILHIIRVRTSCTFLDVYLH